MRPLPLTAHEVDSLEAERAAQPKIGYPGALVDQLIATIRKIQAGPYAAPEERGIG